MKNNKMRIFNHLSLLFCLLSFLAASAQPITLKTDGLLLTITPTGQLSAITNPINGKNYLAMGEKAPLLRIQSGSEWEDATQAIFNEKSGILTLTYPVSKVAADIQVVRHKTHLVFELIRLVPDKEVNAVTWGPFPTIIGQTIGEVIGVVRDGEYAIGIQALNTKTLGGVLKNAEGSEDTRGSVAVSQPYGSSLQAYSLDRSRTRKVTVWNNQYPDMPVAAIPGETTIGSRIALFGCPEAQVLNHIGAIELAEGLPHPLINGTWHKQSPETGRAYLIADFNESNIDAMLDYTRQAGLKGLYHEGPFLSWGHFILDPGRFPNGNEGMKTSVEKAAKMGIRIGVHTLSTFINTNDPYVTPIPDSRLSETGASTLTENIGATATEITVASDLYFKNLAPSTLHAVRIGEEIIRFREVTATAPYKLLDCQRGAYGTKATAHDQGTTAAMLLDYPYNTLFPNFELQQEIAGNLGRFFTDTGVSQMDFDGHEGCLSSGQGDYGMQAFAEKVFRDTRQTLVNGTSRSSHYYWHICHYWNWGEPWYGGFRESQGDYRLENQPLLERNYMPNMLGWFLLSSTTNAADIEWMMARAAGYNAGFALVARYESLQKNPHTTRLLALVHLWEEAKEKKIFSPDQLARLKNPENDFHLEQDQGEWRLYPFKKYQFEHDKKILQPGQPTSSEWTFVNNDGDQPLQFTLTFMGKEGVVANPWIEIDGYYKIEMPGEYEAGNSIVCDGTTLKLYNDKGSFKKELAIRQPVPTLKAGKHIIRFDCGFPNESQLTNRFIIKTMSSPEVIPK
jgi:hypothetical protein